MRITTTVLKSSAIILKIHNSSPFPTQYNVERSKKLCLDGFDTVRGVGKCSASSLQPRLMRDNKMPKPLLQASSSPLPPLRMSRCKIQAQRLSIAGSRMRASELKQRFFVHTQQDVILCPGLMVQLRLNTSLPIKTT